MFSMAILWLCGGTTRHTTEAFRHFHTINTRGGEIVESEEIQIGSALAEIEKMM